MTLFDAASRARAVTPMVATKVPNHLRRNAVSRTVWVGACLDLTTPTRPSQPEVEEVLGLSHACVNTHAQRWLAMPWRERHTWLELIECRRIA